MKVKLWDTFVSRIVRSHVSSDVTFYTRLIKAKYECPTFFQIRSQSLIFHFFFFPPNSLSLSLCAQRQSKTSSEENKKTTLRKLFLFLSLSRRRFAWTLIRSTGNQNNSAGKYKISGDLVFLYLNSSESEVLEWLRVVKNTNPRSLFGFW